MLPKNQEKEDSSSLVDEESKQLQGETQSGSPKKPSAISGIILFIVIIYMNSILYRKHLFKAEATRLVLIREESD